MTRATARCPADAKHIVWGPTGEWISPCRHQSRPGAARAQNSFYSTTSSQRATHFQSEYTRKRGDLVEIAELAGPDYSASEKTIWSNSGSLRSEFKSESRCARILSFG